MKRNIIINGALALVLASSMASCASDYLDTEPKGNVTNAQVGTTTENIAKAINGIGWLMNMYQVASDGSINGGGYPCGTCGEGYMMSFFGDCYGADTYQNHFAIFQGGNMIRMQYVANNSYYSQAKAWGFYYTIIRQANAAMDMLDGAEETIPGQRDQIKAQALTFRAHSYVRLLQIFGPRWSDSKNGERKCIVLRLKQSTDDTPLVTMNQVLDQIYADCKEAAALFSNPDTYQERPDWSAPDYSVACGVLARAALLKEDWATAEQYAAEAQKGHEIMTNAQWCGGFMEANDDYMWTNSIDQEDRHINGSWAAYNACNGNYPNYWQMGSANINVDLYDQLDPNDIRRSRFIMPDQVGVNKATWYRENIIDPTTMFFLSGKSATLRNILAITTFCEKATPPTPSNGMEVAVAYTDIGGRGTAPTYVYGGQVKFYAMGGSDQLNQYPFMRSTEMLLIQAEAAYMQGKTGEAQTLISKLTTMRIPGSAPITKTGDDLLNEIRLQRRIELWGEGQHFFDLKRWNMHNVRRAWVSGDPTSGNCPALYQMDIAPNEANHWVFMLPRVESDYNALIDLSELNWD